MPERALGDLGEFELIGRVVRAAGRAGCASGPGVSLGMGDDAALLRVRAGEEVAVSTDARVEGVHFSWRAESPRTAGRIALVAALSDLAAMGARPLGFTWALAAPADLSLRRFDGLTRGLVAEGARHGCPLVGGNVTRACETSLALTVLGAVRRGRALRRRARLGDRVLVTGRLGVSALARARAGRGGGRLRHVPVPRLRAGRTLARLPGVSGCIDVSDGLDADLAHLLGPGRRCAIDDVRVPRPRGFDAACRRLGLDPAALARGGGDDYELLFAVRPGAASAAALGRRLGVPVTELGRVSRGGSGADARGTGWRHF